MYGDVPPETVKSAAPVEPALHDTFVCDVLAVGFALTVTRTLSVFVQPVAVVVPVTVYSSEVEGVNATPFALLLFQTYVFAPEPESVTDVPAQTVWSAPALTVGKGLTKTALASLEIEVQTLPDALTTA